jgi:hypothetical protein
MKRREQLDKLLRDLQYDAIDADGSTEMANARNRAIARIESLFADDLESMTPGQLARMSHKKFRAAMERLMQQ